MFRESVWLNVETNLRLFAQIADISCYNPTGSIES